MSYPPQEPTAYPSRRSLREARERDEQVSSDTASPTPTAPHAQPVISQPAAATEPAQLAQPVPLAPSPLEGLFLTPLPEFELGGSAKQEQRTTPDPEPARRPRAKRLVAATFSLACVGSLAVTTTLPAFSHAFGSPATAAARADQQLQSSEVTVTQDALDAIGSVELGVDPGSYKQITAEAGLVDPASLESTDIRFAFDREFPLTDGFAYRTAPVEQFHDAQDIAAPGGTPVLAIGSGEVIEAGYATDGCGFSIKLQHNVSGETLTSRYCHMQVDSHDHQVGDKIEIGDFIGKVGNTGMSFGDHLHLALRRSGVPIDPLPYIQEQVDKAAKRAAAKRD